MNNNVGIYHLFGENNKVKKLFYEWCKTNDDIVAVFDSLGCFSREKLRDEVIKFEKKL